MPVIHDKLGGRTVGCKGSGTFFLTVDGSVDAIGEGGLREALEGRDAGELKSSLS